MFKVSHCGVKSSGDGVFRRPVGSVHLTSFVIQGFWLVHPDDFVDSDIIDTVLNVSEYRWGVLLQVLVLNNVPIGPFEASTWSDWPKWGSGVDL